MEWQVVLVLRQKGHVIVDYIKAESEEEAMDMVAKNMEVYKRRIEHLLRYDEIEEYYVLECDKQDIPESEL